MIHYKRFLKIKINFEKVNFSPSSGLLLSQDFGVKPIVISDFKKLLPRKILVVSLTVSWVRNTSRFFRSRTHCFLGWQLQISLWSRKKKTLVLEKVSLKPNLGNTDDIIVVILRCLESMLCLARRKSYRKDISRLRDF